MTLPGTTKILAITGTSGLVVSLDSENQSAMCGHLSPWSLRVERGA